MLKTFPALAAVVVAAVLVFPTVTQAADVHSVRVSFADLNLASDSGRHALQGRIAYAARVACEFEDSRDLAIANATRLCRGDAVANAQPAYDAAVAAVRHGTVTVGDAAALIVTGR